MKTPHVKTYSSRRDILRYAGGGFGMLALRSLLGHAAMASDLPNPGSPDPLMARLKHYGAKAKSVIFLFMEGGPSHLDLFDPKPLVNELAGKPVPKSFNMPITAMGEMGSPILACKRKWKQHGQSGLWISDWYPHIASMADDLAVVRSCMSDGINHAGGICQMNTGSVFGGRPSLGSWVTYGLGTENQNLPAFVVIKDNPAQIVNGARNWGAGFMPAVYQGVELETSGPPISNLNPPEGISKERQQSKLDLMNRMNRSFAAARPVDHEMEARIASYELAFRMQTAAPEVVDLDREPEHIRNMYGMDEKETKVFGRNCLLARRLVERGVRFVQLYSGSGNKWDAHKGIEGNHGKYCRETDKPIAGLLKDLKQRGLLDSTLVVWGGEFGRTPMSEQGDGRDHNPTGFTMWMAGGGVQGGQVIGETDELGLWAVEDKLHVHDLHATVLYLLGLDHTKVIYRHKGRPERVDLNEGSAFEGIMA